MLTVGGLVNSDLFYRDYPSPQIQPSPQLSARTIKPPQPVGYGGENLGENLG